MTKPTTIGGQRSAGIDATESVLNRKDVLTVVPPRDAGLRQKIAKMMTDNNPEADALRVARINLLLQNPKGVPGINTTINPAGLPRSKMRTPRVTFRVPNYPVDPLLKTFIDNPGFFETWKNKYLKEAGVSTVEQALDLWRNGPSKLHDQHGSLNSWNVYAARKLLLLQKVAERLASSSITGTDPINQRYQGLEKYLPYRSQPVVFDQTGHDTASETVPETVLERQRAYPSSRYPLSWFRQRTLKTLAELTAYLTAFGYRFRLRRLDTDTFLAIWSLGPRAPIKAMPNVTVVVDRNKNLIFDLYIGDRRFAVFTYTDTMTPRVVDEDGIPPSMIDPNFDGQLSSSDAFRYRQNLELCIVTIKTELKRYLQSVRRRSQQLPTARPLAMVNAEAPLHKPHPKYRQLFPQDLSRQQPTDEELQLYRSRVDRIAMLLGRFIIFGELMIPRPQDELLGLFQEIAPMLRRWSVPIREHRRQMSPLFTPNEYYRHVNAVSAYRPIVTQEEYISRGRKVAITCLRRILNHLYYNPPQVETITGYLSKVPLELRPSVLIQNVTPDAPLLTQAEPLPSRKV